MNQLQPGINRVLGVIILLTTTVTITSYAQTAYKQTGNSYVSVAGTSTLHNWTMTSKETQFQASFETAPDGMPTQLKSLSLSIPSQSLKSGHNAMDKNAYSSLKTDKHKTISFGLTTASVQKNIIQCAGNLSISGVTKQINVDATCESKPDKTIHCTGSKVMKMSDYQVEPPTFMFGSVKTGDEITITFNVEFAAVK